jgi:hypothetical protein
MRSFVLNLENLMKTTKMTNAIILFIALFLGLAGVVYAAGNIDAVNKWIWGSNIGWINLNPTHDGVTVYEDHLEGYAWAENIGWIRLGTYEGGGTHTYANDAANTYGVNNDGRGNLEGYAWSTNIGWINFNPTHGGVTIDRDTGEFDGYAWAENVGWISFKGGAGATAYGPVTTWRGSPMPEIAVQGNDQAIANGDAMPSTTDGTDFGSVNVSCALVKHTFTISNGGTLDLDLTGSPRVSLDGTGAGHFSVVRQPTSPVGISSSATFAVYFDPTAEGSHQATVSIASSDRYENPYTFVISGTGVSSSGGGSSGGSGSNFIYLPLIFKGDSMDGSAGGSDLVVLDVTITGSEGTVTICNAGAAATPDDFWVDMYVNPNPAPPGINQPWHTIANHGAAWGVTTPLDPDQSLILTTGGAYSYNRSSSFPAGANVYAYVDSINYATTTGNVQESNEGNNVFGPAVSTAGAGVGATASSGGLNSWAGLPER